MSATEVDPYDVIGKLVAGDIIPLMKTILKDLKYSLLYENVYLLFLQ
jgi:hypothetical protein